MIEFIKDAPVERQFIVVFRIRRVHNSFHRGHWPNRDPTFVVCPGPALKTFGTLLAETALLIHVLFIPLPFPVLLHVKFSVLPSLFVLQSVILLILTLLLILSPVAIVVRLHERPGWWLLMGL